MIFSSLFNFHFLNIPLLPFRSQLIIDEVQTGGGATGRLRETSQIVQNNPKFVKFYFSTQERCGCTNTSIFAMGLMLLPLARKCFLEGSTIRYILGLLSILRGYLCNRYSREIIKFFFYQIWCKFEKALTPFYQEELAPKHAARIFNTWVYMTIN